MSTTEGMPKRQEGEDIEGKQGQKKVRVGEVDRKNTQLMPFYLEMTKLSPEELRVMPGAKPACIASF